MANADVACPVWLSRVPTVMSLQQLAQDEEAGGGKKAAAIKTAVQPLACEPRPDCPVSDALGAAIPCYAFPAHECKAQAPQKRVRSFGDLQNALVPDIDERPESPADMSASGGSSDDGEGVVPGGKWGGGSRSSTDVGGVVALSKAGGPQGGLAAPIQMGLLDTILRTEWDERKADGLFRYDVAACTCMMVPGDYGFIAQLNEGRASKKRPTEFRVDQVAQAFDGGKFNFTKALQKEVLCQFQPTLDERPGYNPDACVKGSPNMVFINVSPIEYGHVLLVPRVLDSCPQIVDPASLLLALNFLKQVNNAYFRIGFNSLGAYGTINHLHFQAYFLAAPFPIERADTVAVPGLRRASGSVSISQLSGYAVRGLVFEAGGTLSALAGVVGAACRRLTAANVPHNLFIVDRGARVFLLPNAFAERKAKGLLPEEVLETQVDPASFEIAGHIVLKRAADFEAVSQEACWRLLECASLDEACFLDVVRIALPGEMRGGRLSVDMSRTVSSRLSGSFARSSLPPPPSKAGTHLSGSFVRRPWGDAAAARRVSGTFMRI